MTASHNRTVLITGGSSGIGYELSRCFARDGYHLYWVSLDQDELDRAREDIMAEFPGSRVSSLANDLSQPQSAKAVFEWLKDQKIDVLVNNAGFGTYGLFYENDMEKELAMIQLHVNTLYSLTRYFLKGMLQRDAGHILNISSAVSYQAVPMMATYAGTKAFVRIMSESLRQELQHLKSKVKVTTVCPSAIGDTSFKEVAQMENVRTFNGLSATSAKEVAKDAYLAMKKGKPLIRTGRNYRFNFALSRIFPSAVVRFVIRKEMERKS